MINKRYYCDISRLVTNLVINDKQSIKLLNNNLNPDIMKALKSKNFLTVLQTMVFFKFHSKKFTNQLSEAIKLMSTQQLFANIIQNQYETSLMKDILVFLMSKLENPKFWRNQYGGAIHYFKGEFSQYRETVINAYYMQIALREFEILTNDEHSKEKYENVSNFYQLDEAIKFKLLECLVREITNSVISQVKSKEKEESHDQQGQQSKNKREQVIILGQDNKGVYYFIPFIPQYIFTCQLGRWHQLDRNAVQKRIIKLLQQPQHVNTLTLCQALATISTKYMKNQPQPPIRLHKSKQTYASLVKERFTYLKKQLFQINERYCQFLKNFDNRCWGYINQRENYMNSLQKATSIADLIEAFKYMFFCSNSKLFVCLCDDETQLPEKSIEQFYRPQYRPSCNIHHVAVKVLDKCMVKCSDLTSKLIQEGSVDSNVLFQVIVLALDKAVQKLELKQKKYYEKQKGKKKMIQRSETDNFDNKSQKSDKKGRLRSKSVRNSDSSLSSSIVIANQKLKSGSKMQLRQKKFGVTMLDSDDDSNYEGGSGRFNKYKYKYKS